MGSRGLIGSGLISRGLIGRGSIGSGLMAPGVGPGPSAPTIPVARQTWAAGVRLNGLADNPFGPGQIRNFRVAIRNLTGQAVSDVSFDLFHHLPTAQTFTYSVGPHSGGLDSGSWTAPATVSVPGAPDGIRQPGYARVDVALASPLAPNNDLVISVNAPTSAVTFLPGLNQNAWPAYGFVQVSQMSFGPLAVNASWGGGFDNIFAFVGGVHFRNLTGDPVIQIMHIGDSLGEMERPLGTPNELGREGFAIRGNYAEIANGRRFWWSSYSNGAFLLENYLDRILHLIDGPWIDNVDVVSIQALTHNSFPGSVAVAQAQWAQVEAVGNAVRAAGRGVIYTLLTPPTDPHQGADAIAAWQWIKDRIASEVHIYLDDVVADGTGTAIDPAYSSTIAPEPIHINEAGGILQGAVLPARTATALAALGYVV